MKTIYVINNGDLMELSMNEVTSVNFANGKTTVTTLDNNTFKMASGFDHFANQEGFVVVDRGAIVNLSNVDSFDIQKSELKLKEGVLVHVSNTRTKRVQELLS